jgi:hypothetical protein
MADRQMYSTQCNLSQSGTELPLLGHEQIDIHLPAQRGLKLIRFAEYGCTATRHPRSLLSPSNVKPTLYLRPTRPAYAVLTRYWDGGRLRRIRGL